MSYDELELDRIGDRKTAVFFIISDTTQTYNFLVALAFSKMFNLLCERADNVHGGRLPPFFSRKYDLKKHPNYKYTAEADKKKNAFDLHRLINRRRRPGPEELCEVYKVSVPDNGLTSEDEDILNYDDIDDPDAIA